MNDAEQFTDNSISESIKHTFESDLRVYESIMHIFYQTPYQISIDKLKVFITYQAKKGVMTINTLKSYITALSYYFTLNEKTKSCFYPTNSKGSKAGFNVLLKKTSPYNKLALKKEFFLCYLQQNDMTDIENVKMMFYMNLSFMHF